jgi:hypothetical protein
MPGGAAGVGSKSSLKGRHEDQCALGEPNDDEPTGLCAPTGIAIPIAPLHLSCFHSGLVPTLGSNEAAHRLFSPGTAS